MTRTNKCLKCNKLFMEGGVDKGIYYKCIYCGRIFDVINYKLIERKKEKYIENVFSILYDKKDKKKD